MPGPLSRDSVGLPRARRATGGRAPEIVGLPSAAPPVPPAGLGAAGVAAWGSAFASAAWLQTEADVALVGQFADLHDERADLIALIAAEGRTTVGSQGQLVSHPAVVQLRAVEASIAKLAATLGLGPQNRARLGQKLTAAPGERALTDDERKLALKVLGRDA
ncbi:MAG TPA: P27 family phage terminase small subunit [Solirubrobacteraceae bacterium]|nr:P27 family phage terminase small subunit [Solirubrobacteraceae bacterium]